MSADRDAADPADPDDATAIVAALRDAKVAHGPDMAHALAAVRQRIFGGRTPPPKIGRYVLVDRVGQGAWGWSTARTTRSSIARSPSRSSKPPARRHRSRSNV